MPDPLTAPLIGFLSGIGVSLAAALVADALTRHRERRRLVEERRFQVYMKLMELHGTYFWFTTAEIKKEPVPDEIRRKCFDLAWQIADLLRSADEVDYLDDTLDVTLGSHDVTPSQRYESMSQLLDRLGRRVNPRYSRKIHEISEANVRAFASGGRSNAPGASSSWGVR